jgi:hypothetical protein
MIEKSYNEFRLICDICGKEKAGFEYWDEAKDAKKELGWISRNTNGEWEDICDDCIKA